ncbi:unnamed protein product [Microthlaspi erraticum]|uniref:Uncharacterized protein n=1 Tax=Microthlaspi erraticum TaxID=1685480 RepID=A0A6D2JLZ6_9BRAS|nr:unnamed protein product [Microthlaspi erraticum]
MQYRDFSSRADVTTSNKIAARLVKLAFAGFGYCCGVLTIDPVAKKLVIAEENILRDIQIQEEREAMD